TMAVATPTAVARPVRKRSRSVQVTSAPDGARSVLTKASTACAFAACGLPPALEPDPAEPEQSGAEQCERDGVRQEGTPAVVLSRTEPDGRNAGSRSGRGVKDGGHPGAEGAGPEAQTPR